MSLTLTDTGRCDCSVLKIVVAGPRIVGVPMPALLDTPALVVEVQGASRNSGWEVKAINTGRSAMEGVVPALQGILVIGRNTSAPLEVPVDRVAIGFQALGTPGPEQPNSGAEWIRLS
jgi:hypothetical protein